MKRVVDSVYCSEIGEMVPGAAMCTDAAILNMSLQLFHATGENWWNCSFLAFVTNYYHRFDRCVDWLGVASRRANFPSPPHPFLLCAVQ